jgi:hypothetical protein
LPKVVGTGQYVDIGDLPRVSKEQREMILRAAKTYDVDPRLIYSDYGSESSFGTTVTSADPFHQFGLIAGVGQYDSYGHVAHANTFQEAAMTVAAMWAYQRHRMPKNYTMDDLITARNAWYAPTKSATNDPTHLNKNKNRNVLSMINSVGLATPAPKATSFPKPKEAGFVPHIDPNKVIDATAKQESTVGRVWNALGNLATGSGKFLDMFLGAPERLYMGAMNAGVDHGKSLPEALGRGWFVASHSGNDALQKRELDEFASGVMRGLGIATGNKDIHLANDPFHRELQKFAIQFMADPTNLFPLVEALKGTKAAREAWTIAANATSGSAKTLGLAIADKILPEMTRRDIPFIVSRIDDMRKRFFQVRPKLDKHLDQYGKEMRLSVEEKWDQTFDYAAKMRDDLFRKFPQLNRAADMNADLLKLFDGNLAKAQEARDAVKRARLFQEWAFGTSKVRRQAIARGFTPTAEEVKRFPQALNVLANSGLTLKQATKLLYAKYPTEKIREIMGNVQNVTDEQKLLAVQKALNIPAGRGVGGQIRSHLHAIEEAAKRTLVDKETAAWLRAAPSHWKGPGPIDVRRLTHLADEITRPSLLPPYAQEFGALTSIGRTLGKLNVIGSFLPHGLRNVGMLAGITGGLPTFMRGLGHAVDLGGYFGRTTTMARGLSQIPRAAGLATAQRAKNLGLLVDYAGSAGADLGELFKEKGILGLSQFLTERLENGFRLATLEYADQIYGASKTAFDDFRKAQFVRDTLGDYRNVTGIVQLFKMIGGPFATFHLGIVPKAVLSAIGRRPAYVEDVIRAQDRARDAGLKGLVVGGPVSEVSDLLNPAHAITYILNRSDTGLLGNALNIANDTSREGFGGFARDVGEDLSQAAITTVPSLLGERFGGIGPVIAQQVPAIQAAMNIDPYDKAGRSHAPKDMSPLGRALFAEFGAYFRGMEQAHSGRTEASIQRNTGKVIAHQRKQAKAMVKVIEKILDATTPGARPTPEARPTPTTPPGLTPIPPGLTPIPPGLTPL